MKFEEDMLKLELKTLIEPPNWLAELLLKAEESIVPDERLKAMSPPDFAA